MSPRGRRDRAEPSRVLAALTVLRERGERVTRVRQAVIKVLDGTDEHLGADEIVQRAEEIVPGVHRASVYRALSTLGDLGLVIHTYLGGSAAVYHLALPPAPGGDGNGSHAHLQCTRCHQVIDIGIEIVQPIATELDRSLGFRLVPQHTALLGICADCRRRPPVGSRP